MNINDYNTIIGSGGYGLILKNDNKDTVIKLLYNGGCKQAGIEYFKHLILYKILSKKTTTIASQVCIAKPLIFNQKPIIKNGQHFSCFYEMSLLHSIDPYLSIAPSGGNNGLYHIISDSAGNVFNKKFGRIYNKPISDENPSRGFFATYIYINNNILPNLDDNFKKDLKNINDILFRIGYIFGIIIFVAEYKPIDVEYVLADCNMILNVAVLDFGMIEKIDWTVGAKIADDIQDNILDIDIYFPIPGTIEMEYFLQGFTFAFGESDKTNKKKLVFDKLIKNNSKIIQVRA